MSTHELRSALETIFGRPVAGLQRSPSPYSSSFTIEELQIAFQNGEIITAVFKNLSADAMLETARKTKPDFVYAPGREIVVYRSILSSMNLGTAKLYGAVVDAGLQRYWLFLEKVPAHPLDEIGEFEVWLKVARWLARFHAASDSNRLRGVAPQLLQYDAAYYRRWLQRAHESAGAALDRLAARYERVIDILLKVPPVFMHGEFYASNILVQEREGGFRVCAVDWEMAAIGPGLLDLAALTSGKWSREARLSMLEAYCRCVPENSDARDLVTAFDCCQLHIALQWLGWWQSWSPPPAHACDWLAEALRIANADSLRPVLGAM